MTFSLHLGDLFHTLPPTDHLMASHSSPCDKPPVREGGPKEHRTKQKWPRETRSTYAPGYSTPSYLLRIVAQTPPTSICCPRPPSHFPIICIN